MPTKTAIIRKLAITNILIALIIMAFGLFAMEKPVAAQANTIPSKINTLTATSGTLSALLSWEAPAEDVTSYTVEYGTVASGVFDNICSNNDCVDPVPGALVTDLQQDTEYMFRVTPSNSAGTGEPSNIVTLTIKGPCSNMETTDFCGQQIITAPTLRFTKIPSSFNFPPINIYNTPPQDSDTIQTLESGSATPDPKSTPPQTTPQSQPLTLADFGKAQVINDIPGTGTFPPINISSTAQNVYNNSNSTNQPALEDLLGIQDNRNSGGFEVQLQANGNFTDGTHTIPLSNLYVGTSVNSPVYNVPATDTAYPCPSTNCGVIYGSSVTTRGILAPADTQGLSLGMPGTFTTNLGSGAVVLMDGGLPSTQGRNGYMYQFISYYLKVPAFQAAGDYAVKLTFTLIDKTN
jgi:hypothetical protein